MQKNTIFISSILSAFLLIGCGSSSSTSNSEESAQDNIENVENIQDNIDNISNQDYVDNYENNLSEEFFGRWTYADSGEVLYIDRHTNLEGATLNLLNKNQLQLEKDNNARYLIRSGISDIKLAGELAIIDNKSQAPSRGFSLNSLKLKLKHKATEIVKEYAVKVTEDENLTNKIKDGAVYLSKLKNGHLNIPKDLNLTMPTGDVELSFSDGNKTSILNIDMSGRDINFGVITLTDTPYNFKSFILTKKEMESNRYGIVATSSDGYTEPYIPEYWSEDDKIAKGLDISLHMPVNQTKHFHNKYYEDYLMICNSGTEAISGANFTIKEHNSSEFSIFSVSNYENYEQLTKDENNTYKSAAIGFDAYECKKYILNFQPVKPKDSSKYQIDIQIKDNVNNITWNDYATINVSKYDAKDIYFRSNQKGINGYIILDANQIKKVNISPNSWDENILTVENNPDAEYELVLSAKNVSDEDVYTISTSDSFFTTGMNSFTDVTKDEPNNDKDHAKYLAMNNDKVMGYLLKGDIDYYILKDIPNIKSINEILYHTDDKLVIEFNTEIDNTTINSNNIKVTSDGDDISTSISLKDGKYLFVNFDNNLTNGDYTIKLNNIKSKSGNLMQETIKSFKVSTITTPTVTAHHDLLPTDNNYFYKITVADNIGLSKYKVELYKLKYADIFLKIGSFNIDNSSISDLSQVIVIDNNIFIYGDNYIESYNITNGKKVFELNVNYNISKIFYKNSSLYIVDNNHKLYRYDISNTDSIELKASSTTIQPSHNIIIDNNIIYAISNKDDNNTFSIFDASSLEFNKTIADIGSDYGYTLIDNNSTILLLNENNDTTQLVYNKNDDNYTEITHKTNLYSYNNGEYIIDSKNHKLYTHYTDGEAIVLYTYDISNELNITKTKTEDLNISGLNSSNKMNFLDNYLYIRNSVIAVEPVKQTP